LSTQPCILTLLKLVYPIYQPPDHVGFLSIPITLYGSMYGSGLLGEWPFHLSIL
jgi:hypothetical protein